MSRATLDTDKLVPLERDFPAVAALGLSIAYALDVKPPRLYECSGKQSFYVHGVGITLSSPNILPLPTLLHEMAHYVQQRGMAQNKVKDLLQNGQIHGRIYFDTLKWVVRCWYGEGREKEYGWALEYPCLIRRARAAEFIRR